MRKQTEQELDTFIEEWKESPDNNKAVFVHFRDCLLQKKGVTLDFVSRPGVTYSLRATHSNQKEKPLFVMVDVIEDTPRWLSVCFYGETITDPEGRGDFVPGGLLGEDAVCFDLEQQDKELARYIETRLDEAFLSAAGLM